MLKKKIWPNFQRIVELLPKKLSLSSQQYGFGIRDPRSGIRKKTYPGSDPGVKNAPDPGSATLVSHLAASGKAWAAGAGADARSVSSRAVGCAHTHPFSVPGSARRSIIPIGFFYLSKFVTLYLP
jgi:hypothetical protein